MAQHLQYQSIRSPPLSDEKGVALFPLRRFSDDERRREEYFAGVERGVAHSLRERGERGFGDAVARLAYRRELSGTPSARSDGSGSCSQSGVVLSFMPWYFLSFVWFFSTHIIRKEEAPRFLLDWDFRLTQWVKDQ